MPDQDEAPQLLDVGIAIADGRSIDWDTLASASPTDAGRIVLDDLRVIAEIVAVHQRLTPAPDASVSAADELRETQGAAGADTRRSPQDSRDALATWGHLRLIEQVGQGAFGEVYRAWDSRLDRDVALKLLRRRDSQRPQGSSVIEEGRLLARVRHSNVITVYGADRVGDHVGVWMEFIEGRTLEQLLKEQGSFDVADATRIGIDLCRALGAVHGAGLLHRDIKAQNVMREADGRIVLMDFGAGREEQSDRTASDLAGTPLYLAPEIFTGDAASPHSDLYSVGVLLFRLVTGTYPVTGHSVHDVRTSHQRGERIRLDTIRPDLPRVFVDIVNRALASDPTQRFERAADMEAALVALTRPAAPDAARLAVSRRWKVAGAGLAVLALTTATWMARGVLFGHTAPVAATFQAGDWLLITAIENRTDEGLFDGSIAQALEHEVATRHIRVVSRERVEETLRLMDKAVPTVVNAELGREVAVRDGRVRAVLSGQLERRNGTYVIHLQLVESTSGAIWATADEDAQTNEHVFGAIQRQAAWIRRVLGDPTRSASGSRNTLRSATTSLRALQHYSEAVAHFARNRWDQAEAKARAALAEDSNFASAHILLALALRNERRPASEYLPLAERALALSDGLSERERYSILGSFYTLRGQYEEARSALEALVEIDPDYFLALNRLANTYQRLKRAREGIIYFTQHADMHPHSFMANYWAAVVLVSFDTTRAVPYGKRALDVLQIDGDPYLLKLRAWLQGLPAFERWMEGDVEGASREVTALVERTKTPTSKIDHQVGVIAGFFYLALGRLRTAEELFALIDDGGEGYLPLVNFVRGESPVVRQHPRNMGSTNAMVFARAGLESEVRRILETYKGNPESFFTVPEGVIAMKRGRTSKAISLLERGLGTGQLPSWPHAYMGAEALAEIWWRQGSTDKALAVLDRVSGNRHRTYNGDYALPYFWIRSEAQRAAYLRRLGRLEEARGIEGVLLKLLSQGDADFPLLVELKARPFIANDPQPRR